jgi:hypothetical protein
MEFNMHELIARTRKESDADLVRALAPGAKTQEEINAFVEQTTQTIETMKALMTTHRTGLPQRRGVTTAEGDTYLKGWERGEQRTPLKMSEALHSTDSSMMFKRVISDVLVQPKETTYIGQDILAKTIRVDGVRSAMFPAMGAIRAFDISEAGEYPEQQPSFTEHMLELKVQKSGLRLAITDEVIEDSMWDIFGLYVTMASNAMDRFKEEKIMTAAVTKAVPVFDNAITNDANAVTTGLDINGVPNGSVSFTDLMDVIGALLANGYTPTDLLLHPLAWVMLAKDPRLIFHMLHSANYGSSVPMPDLTAAGIQKNLPFGNINVVVTPQLPFKYNTALTMNTTGTNGGGTTVMAPCNIGSIICIDRQSSLVVLQRDDKHMEEFDHHDRDIHMLKVSERYAVGALDFGLGMAAINNIRLVQNHESVFNVGQGHVS